MYVLKLAVLGAGHGGVAMSADLTLAGHEVSLFEVPECEESFRKIKETKEIEIDGAARQGKATLRKATTDIAEAMEDVDHVIVVVPAFAHQRMAELCIPYIQPGQFIFVVPGSFGSFYFYKKIREVKGSGDFTVAETSTLPYGTRKTGDNNITVHIRTVNLPMGVLPPHKTTEAVELFRQFYPETTPCSNILDSALSNTNPVIHVAPTLLNTGRIEYADDFYLYREGMTESVRKVMLAADRERIAVRKAFGLSEPHYELPTDSYEVFRDQFGEGALQAGQKMRGPLSMEDRYVTEDVPFGMVFYSSMARLAGVETPICDSLINIASVINIRDYFSEGRNLNALGLEDWSRDQLLSYLQQG